MCIAMLYELEHRCQCSMLEQDCCLFWQPMSIFLYEGFGLFHSLNPFTALSTCKHNSMFACKTLFLVYLNAKTNFYPYPHYHAKTIKFLP